MASVPWITGALFSMIGGLLCDWACKRFGPRWGYRGPAATASAIMNTGGNLVGVISTPMFVLLERQFGAAVAIAVAVLFSLLAAALWMMLRFEKHAVPSR